MENLKITLEEDMMRSLIASILGVFLLAGSAFAMCPHAKSGDHASVLADAAKALETSNPELSAKVKAIADECCALGLHNEAKAAASEHPTGGSEHPSSEHPS